MTKLYHHTFRPWTVADGTRVVASERAWSKPLKLDRDAAKTGERVRVFVGVDVFEGSETMPLDAIKPVRKASVTLYDVIARTTHLDWLLFTNRPHGVMDRVEEAWRDADAEFDGDETWSLLNNWIGGIPPANLWLGTSITTQAEADERIPHLLRVPAAVRYVRLTPKEEMNVARWLYSDHDRASMDNQYLSPLPGTPEASVWFSKLDLVIVSGDTESIHLDCVRSLRDQCVAADVAFWFDHTLDGREWNELPEVGK